MIREPVECSSANPTTLLLQPKQHGGPLGGLFVPEEKNQIEKPEKRNERKVLWGDPYSICVQAEGR